MRTTHTRGGRARANTTAGQRRTVVRKLLPPSTRSVARSSQKQKRGGPSRWRTCSKSGCSSARHTRAVWPLLLPTVRAECGSERGWLLSVHSTCCCSLLQSPRDASDSRAPLQLLLACMAAAAGCRCSPRCCRHPRPLLPLLPTPRPSHTSRQLMQPQWSWSESAPRTPSRSGPCGCEQNTAAATHASSRVSTRSRVFNNIPFARQAWFVS
jgi:hypothetical protein